MDLRPTIRRVYRRVVRRPDGGPTGASEMGRAEPQFPPTFGTRPFAKGKS
jgi:hypothetical protein